MLPHKSQPPAHKLPEAMLPQNMYDQHTIETPEQMSLQLDLAGIGSRFLAIAIDTLIQILIVLVLLLCLFFIGLADILPRASSGVWVIAAFFFAYFLLFYGYYAVFEIIWNGQTPGKRKIGIRVVKDSGRPLNATETIGRNLMRIVDQLPFLYLIGVVVAMCNSQGRRLGDFVAGSIVIREGSLENFRPEQIQGLSSQPTATGMPQWTAGAEALSMEDLTLIDTFLGRRHNLELDVRSRTAAQILARVQAKTGKISKEGRSDETVLESLAYERRFSGPK